MWGSPLLDERLSWPEVRRAAGEERVCLIPVATISVVPIPPGCRFNPRCPIAIPECRTVDPELRTPAGAAASHLAACVRA